MSRRCDELAELRSGFVDGALAPADRERVVGHLLGCEACREDVAQLRAVRDLLNRTRPASGPAPADLSSRLVSIAGQASDQPLWTRAFGRSSSTDLPSRRRRAPLRATVGVLAFGVVVGLVGVIGWAAAPTSRLAAVADPADEAQAEFGAAVGELSLAGASLSALMMLDAMPTRTVDSGTVARPGTGTGERLGSVRARRTLQRATNAGQAVSLVGRQTVLVRAHDRFEAAVVQVDTRRGQGSQLSLLDASGQPVAKTFAPAPTSTLPQQAMLDVLDATYAFAGRQGASVAGRPAAVVEAVRDGHVAKRWWVDEATGVLLWQEGYDDDGRILLSTGFTSVRLMAPDSTADRLPTRAVPTGMTTSLAPSSAVDLEKDGWACADDIVGLGLLALSTDLTQSREAVHSVYGDGLHTVSVLQQRGRLARAPEDASWDATLGAWRHEGAVTWATWQSGDTVLTATTDGSEQLLGSVVASLPRPTPVPTSTLDRIRDGWSQILRELKG